MRLDREQAGIRDSTPALSAKERLPRISSSCTPLARTSHFNFSLLKHHGTLLCSALVVPYSLTNQLALLRNLSSPRSLLSASPTRSPSSPEPATVSDSSLPSPSLPRELTSSAPTSTPLELSAPSSLSASSREARPRPLPSSLMWERRRTSGTWWPRPWRSSAGSMSCCE